MPKWMTKLLRCLPMLRFPLVSADTVRNDLARAVLEQRKVLAEAEKEQRSAVAAVRASEREMREDRRICVNCSAFLPEGCGWGICTARQDRRVHGGELACPSWSGAYEPDSPWTSPLVAAMPDLVPLAVTIPAAENLFGKTRGRFDEAAALASDRMLPERAIGVIVPMPPAEFDAFVRLFNDVFGRDGRSRRFEISEIGRG